MHRKAFSVGGEVDSNIRRHATHAFGSLSGAVEPHEREASADRRSAPGSWRRFTIREHASLRGGDDCHPRQSRTRLTSTSSTKCCIVETNGFTCQFQGFCIERLSKNGARSIEQKIT